jgi:hypothetical protein
MAGICCIYVYLLLKLGVIIFGSVQFLSKKKSNQTSFFLKKNKTEPEPVQTDRFRFIILEQKQVQTGLAGFSGLARFFSVRFFQFHAYKTKTEPVYFFKILISLIGFFS